MNGSNEDATPANVPKAAERWLTSVVVPSYQMSKLRHDLMEECKRCLEDSILSEPIRTGLESYSREVRREIVKKVRNGCAPLFVVAKRGCVPIAEYLITVCEADIEQRGLYEVPEDRSFHYVTPFWCATVTGKLPMVKYLLRVGADINATSDSGSTPVRSACYMTHEQVVRYLVENGADIKKPNMNGGTCLINSVQSLPLCLFLIQKGADVDAKDIQEKTALHYAIQEHRLETTKLLLKYGANPYATSRYGDDALRTACLKGAHQIFDYLKTHLLYTPERLAEAHELIGTTFLDEHNETRVAILHWRLAHHIRASHTPYIEKLPKVPLRAAYYNAVEFRTLEELDNISTDMDAMRIQSLLICERILGISHKDMLFRLTFRGASYADSLQMQRCINLWHLLLEIRIHTNTLLHHDTCYVAQALVRLMLDLYERSKLTSNRSNGGDGVAAAGVNRDGVAVVAGAGANLPIIHHADVDEKIPCFDDVLGVFRLLTEPLVSMQELLQIRPVFRKHQENFDRILKCVTHLIYLLMSTAETFDAKRKSFCAIRQLVRNNICSACTNDTLLHLCVSRLNVIKNNYLSDESIHSIIFPNADVIKILLDCGVKVNAKNEAKSTALHVAAQPYNFNNNILQLLLDHGADLYHPNKTEDRPFNIIIGNPANTIPLMNYINLKSLAAKTLTEYKINYKNANVPKSLQQFLTEHEP